MGRDHEPPSDAATDPAGDSDPSCDESSPLIGDPSSTLYATKSTLHTGSGVGPFQLTKMPLRNFLNLLVMLHDWRIWDSGQRHGADVVARELDLVLDVGRPRIFHAVQQRNPPHLLVP